MWGGSGWREGKRKEEGWVGWSVGAQGAPEALLEAVRVGRAAPPSQPPP
jgi:hypothetical protein